ncbi:hypothetical protein C2G38_2315544 [Gigaspora rosea]|uniref:Uncharacterized protein n=1 Tax=Gigaspora rosea TaxID=44941 RepID=A0A397V2X9_9GLOM|nr:hypothetical protein C2G38_2315544 [Gigaspora rosea]
MPHISKRRNQIKNLPRKKGRFITQEEVQKIIEVQNGISSLSVKRVYSKNSRTTIWRRNKKKKENEIKFRNNYISFTTSNMLLDTSASSNMLLNTKASSNISLSRSSHETLQSFSSHTDAASILRMHLDNINKSSYMLLDAEASNNINDLSNMLLDAKASSNMLLNYEASNDILLDAEASSNLSLSRSSHETLQSSSSPTDAASILCMHLDNINESSNMLLDAEASSNMLLNYEASNDILLDAKASSNISLLSSSHETLQSTSSPTDAASILCMHLDNFNKECQIKKSSKSSISIYDYLCLLSISKYIQLLLNGQGKMNASIQITKTLWNKGDYMSRCIRTWSDFI